MTPEMMSPSLPENSPNLMSSSASRRRCSMICFAVVAAIRPKPSGVSSYSATVRPSSSVSAASTVTWPVLRSSETRAFAWAPGDLWYAVRSACSMASTRISKEISFSRSSDRRMFMSMSMTASGLLPVELDLHLRPGDLVVGDLAPGALVVDHGARVVALHDAPGHLCPALQRDLDQASDVAPPVPGQHQGAVRARGGHLEGVGVLPHDVGVVEDPGDLLGHDRDVVQRHAAVLVDRDPQQTPTTGLGQLEGFHVDAGRGERSGQDLGKAVPGLLDAHGVLPAVLLWSCAPPQQ